METNSEHYWNSRFENDWSECRGREQTLFFYKILLSSLPEWLANAMRRECMSICDFGCALGDGSDLLAQYFPGRVTGVDFAEVAIQQARETFPRLNFENWDLRERFPKNAFDVIVSSNTLEHFADPWESADKLAEFCNKAIVLLLPYREFRRHEEHEVTFDAPNIPLTVAGGKFVLTQSSVVDARLLENTEWHGEQILLVYAEGSFLHSQSVSLGHVAFEKSPAVVLQQDWAKLIEEGERRQAQFESALLAFQDGAGSVQGVEIIERLGIIHSEMQAASVNAVDKLAQCLQEKGVLEERSVNLTRELDRMRSENFRLSERMGELVNEFRGKEDALISSRAQADELLHAAMERVSTLEDITASCRELIGASLELLAQFAVGDVKHEIEALLGKLALKSFDVVEVQSFAAYHLRDVARRYVAGLPSAVFIDEGIVDGEAPIARLPVVLRLADRIRSLEDELSLAESRIKSWEREWLSTIKTVERLQLQVDVLESPQNVGVIAEKARALEATLHNIGLQVFMAWQSLIDGEDLTTARDFLEQIEADRWRRDLLNLKGTAESLVNTLSCLEQSMEELNAQVFNAWTAASENADPADARASVEAIKVDCWKDDLLHVKQLAGSSETGLANSPQSAKPLVSVVLPIYNQAEFAEQSIESVIAQTYSNWELIVLDDGSADGLAEVVRKFADDKRIKFVRQVNQKLPAALNNAFHFARGQYLTWTSADNIMAACHLERLLEALEKRPECGLAYSDYWVIDDRGLPHCDMSWRPHNRDQEIPHLIRLPNEVTLANFHESGDNFLGASFMYRRDVAQIAGRYSEKTFGGEDYDFWLRLHLITDFVHVKEPLYYYRVHDNTLSARARELRLFDNIQALLRDDQWRRNNLLASGLTPSTPETGLRPASQYSGLIAGEVDARLYSAISQGRISPSADSPIVIELDVHIRKANSDLLSKADIVICQNDFALEYIRKQPWARRLRLVKKDEANSDALHHAYALVYADKMLGLHKATEPGPLPRLDAEFKCRRVLLLVDRWAHGGVESVVSDLALQFAAEGKHVHVASFQGQAPLQTDLPHTAVRRVTFDGSVPSLVDYVGQHRIEVVNYHHCTAGVTDVQAAGASTIYTLHNCYLWFDETQRANLASVFKSMDRFIAVSPQVAQFACHNFGLDPLRMEVVPNGLPKEKLPAPSERRRKGKDKGKFNVLSLASFNRVKLQGALIAGFEKAAQDRPDLHLHLIGHPLDPVFFDEVFEQVNASPVSDQITIIPGVTRESALKLLSTSQLFALPSALEGWSIALMEAIAARCVVVASDVGSASSLVVEGGSLLLVPSPLGELDDVSFEDFRSYLACRDELHINALADAISKAYDHYDEFAAATAYQRDQLLSITDMGEMSARYCEVYR